MGAIIALALLNRESSRFSFICGWLTVVGFDIIKILSLRRVESIFPRRRASIIAAFPVERRHAVPEIGLAAANARVTRQHGPAGAVIELDRGAVVAADLYPLQPKSSRQRDSFSRKGHWLWTVLP